MPKPERTITRVVEKAVVNTKLGTVNLPIEDFWFLLGIATYGAQALKKRIDEDEE